MVIKSPASSALRRPMTRPRQRGQAVIWLLGTMAASAAVLYAVFNVGQITTAKAKTVNAADAAALAGATVEARMLNLVAYNNRSMIANEVLLIQMLSLESWLGYFYETAQNIGIVLDITVVLAEVGAFLEETSTVAQQLRDDVVKPLNDVLIAALEVVKTGMAVEHAAVLTAGGALAENAASNVVAANRSAFGVHADAGVQLDNRGPVRALTFVANNARWNAFTRRYTGNNRTDARQILLDSRDDFSTNRPGQGPFNLNLGLVGLTKLGGSTLQGFNRWETEDTWELWEWTGKRHYQPVGWGRANADQRGNSGSTWSPNRTAQTLARADGTNHSHRGWSGVPSVYDIADKRAASRAALGVDFVVAVRRPQANTMTSTSMGMGLAQNQPFGSSEMPERLQANELSAVAKARVSFERPQRNNADRTANTLFRADSAKEYGSLFSPYWQARLVDMTVVEKAAMLTAMGINPLMEPFTPGGQP